MGTTSDGIQSFPAARVLIGPMQVSYSENVAEPFALCTIICVNGGIWDHIVNWFTATEDRVRALWDTAPQEFTKRAITQ